MTTALDVLPRADRSQGEPSSFTTLDGSVRLHIDPEEYEFYIDARVPHDPKSLCGVLTQAEWWGLEVMPHLEVNPEIIEENGVTWVRNWLTPMIDAKAADAWAW